MAADRGSNLASDPDPPENVVDTLLDADVQPVRATLSSGTLLFANAATALIVLRIASHRIAVNGPLSLGEYT